MVLWMPEWAVLEVVWTALWAVIDNDVDSSDEMEGRMQE